MPCHRRGMTTTSADYLLSNALPEAGDRFAALSACFDRATFDTLSGVGVDSGWRCWDVGAGGPSVAGWLAERVGTAGTVVATDIDVSRLSTPPTGVDVLVHDVALDDPPGRDFDLVHARLVLTHVRRRDRALERMAGALAPGGWLVIEDFDVAMGPQACPDARTDDERRANRIRTGFISLLAARGVDLRFGRSLPARLRDLGLVDVTAEARFPVADPAMRTLERANIAQVADALIEAGHTTAAEIEEHLRALDRLDIASPPLFVVRARRPESEPVASTGTASGELTDVEPRLVAIRPEADVLRRDRLEGFVGLSDRTCGARSLSMQLVVLPPGAESPAHFHPLHETGVYVISGDVEVFSGPALEHRIVGRGGDLVFTPPGVLHAARNASDTAPAYLIAARNDPSEHEATIVDRRGDGSNLGAGASGAIERDP